MSDPPKLDIGPTRECDYCAEGYDRFSAVSVSWHSAEFCSQSCRDKWRNSVTP